MATGKILNMSVKQNKRAYVGSAIGQTAISFDSNAYKLEFMACPYPTAGTKTFLSSSFDIGIIRFINPGISTFICDISNNNEARIRVAVNLSNNTVTLNTFDWYNTDLKDDAQIILSEVVL